MVLFRCSIEASWLKSFLRLYGSLSDECHLLFTEEHVEGKTMDATRTKAISFKIFPLEYYARDRPSRKWVRVSTDTFEKTIRRYKKGELVPIEARDDGKLWVGGVQIGFPEEEGELPEQVIFPLPKLTRDGTLRVAIQSFRRIVESVTGFTYVGFQIEGREGVMTFFIDEEKFETVKITPYLEWLLEVEGKVLSTYRIEEFKMLLVLGLSDVARISFMHQGPCQVTYTGDFFDVDVWTAPSEVYDTFRVILEKKPPSRRLIWRLEGEDVKTLSGVLRAVNSIFRGNEVWFGVSSYDIWIYWSFIDKGFVQTPKSRFTEFHVDGTLAGSFILSNLAPWFRDVEVFEGWIEEDKEKAMILTGRGKAIAPKELRSEEFRESLDVPEVRGDVILRGTSAILKDVFDDAVIAEADFLVFIAFPHEIRVIGKDIVYYRAALPMNGFGTVEEDYIPVSRDFIKPLREFFGVIPVPVIGLGKSKFDIYMHIVTRLGELKALLAQTADQVESAEVAYREEVKPPVPAPPEEVKPLAPPPEIVHVEVRMLQPIPQIVGADMKTYGPWLAGQMAWLPKENADALVKQGLAEYPKPPPPKMSFEEFHKLYFEKLPEHVTHFIELYKPGLSGELHYQVPEREEEYVAKFTLETIVEKNKEEIEEDVKVAYGSYEKFAEKGAGDVFIEKWLPNRLHRFIADITKKTMDQLLDEAKKLPKPPVAPPEELPRIHATRVEVGKFRAGEYYVMFLNPEKYGDRPIITATRSTIGEVEELVAIGKELYDVEELGIFPEPGEEWWEELAEELKHDAEIYWTAEDLVWSEEVEADRVIWHKTYTRDELELLSVDELRRICGVKVLSPTGRKEELIDRILGVPEKPPAVPEKAPPKPPAPPKKPPVVLAPPPPEKGLAKADEARLLARFRSLLLENGITPDRWRPMFDDRLYEWREAFKDLPRDEAVKRGMDEVERLVGRVMDLAKPKPPAVAPPVVRPPEEVPPVPPVVIGPPVAPPPRVIREWGMPWSYFLCPAHLGEGQEVLVLRSPYLESRLRMLGIPTRDPLFFELCEEHKRKYGGAFELFPRDTIEFWVGEAVDKAEIDIATLVATGISEDYVLHCVRVYEENKEKTVQ